MKARYQGWNIEFPAVVNGWRTESYGRVTSRERPERSQLFRVDGHGLEFEAPHALPKHVRDRCTNLVKQYEQRK